MTHPTDPALPSFRHPQPSAIYDYRREDGALDFIVCRWDADGDTPKRFQQWHHDGARWVPKARAADGGYLRPLYNLPEASSRHAAPVLIVEGEKTFEGCLQYLPDGWVATSWAGGVNGISRTDWTPLQGRRVVIWPDNDEPGLKAAAAIAAITGGKIIATAEFPLKWDLADALPDGVTASGITSAILVAAAPTDIILIPEHASDGPPPDDRGKDTSPLNGHGVVIATDYIRSEKGAPKPLLANAIRCVLLSAGVWNLRYDEFANIPYSAGEKLTDNTMRNICEWIQHEGVHVGKQISDEAILACASRDAFHPVKEYLDALVWDKIPRIDHLLIDFAGAEETDLTRAFTSRWLIQAIARVYEPGCVARATLVLEGPQDIGKSTIFRELFGDKWFTDHLPDITNKDALMQLRGVWCIEIAELATLGRADTARIKQFLTSRVDRYRDPYGRLVADHPRACVFAGTVNPGAKGYLKDETGATRFWPLSVSTVDIASIRGNRDQVWAEALARYRTGERYYLHEPELIEAARVAQRDRFEADPWQESIETFADGKPWVRAKDIHVECLSLTSKADWDWKTQSRIAGCMSHMGWHRIQRRYDGKREWVYVPKADGSEAKVSPLFETEDGENNTNDETLL